MPTSYTLILHADRWRLAATDPADGTVTWLDLVEGGIDRAGPADPADPAGATGTADVAPGSNDAPSSDPTDAVTEPGTSDAATLTSESESDLAQRAEQVRRALRDYGHGDEPILLALPAPWCLTATVSTEGLERSNRRRALAFQLEEHLPLAAEDVTADYVEHADGHALGVATELASLRATIEALETLGLSVAHACPASMLLAAEIMPAEKRAAAEAALLIDGVTGWELIETRNGRPVAWWWCGHDRASLDEHLARWADQQTRTDPALSLYHLTSSAAASASSTDAPQRDAVLPANFADTVRVVPVQRADVDEPVVRQSARVQVGEASPWIDFRRDALAAPGRFQTYRRPAVALVVATIALLVGIFVTGWFRAEQYRDLAAEHRAGITAHFREALPDQSVPPVGVLQRMASEYRNLAGVGGQVSDGRTAAELHPLSALRQLQVVLDVMPDDLRYRILDLTIQPDRVRIEGEARQHADAERLVVALRESGWYETGSPKTQSLRDRGVGFVFTAQPRVEAAVSDEAARAGTRPERPTRTAAAARASVKGGRP